jgi:PIN domain nuclease of toxin-antitoxin system
MASDYHKLGPVARAALEDARNELYLSAASLWEVSTKHRIGKFPAGGILMENLSILTQRLKVQTLAISVEHAITAGSLTWDHRDPFDRMLAAQCIIENMALASKDSAFASLNDDSDRDGAGGTGNTGTNRKVGAGKIEVLWG